MNIQNVIDKTLKYYPDISVYMDKLRCIIPVMRSIRFRFKHESKSLMYLSCYINNDGHPETYYGYARGMESTPLYTDGNIEDALLELKDDGYYVFDIEFNVAVPKEEW